MLKVNESCTVLTQPTPHNSAVTKSTVGPFDSVERSLEGTSDVATEFLAHSPLCQNSPVTALMTALVTMWEAMAEAEEEDAAGSNC